MLLFIVPLKSEESSSYWPLTCQLLERCLRSICNQTNPHFQVLVVCNKRPDIAYSHPQLEYLEVDLKIPKTYEEKSFDKSQKTILGLIYSKKYSVDHVMIVDADDCVSNRIAAFVNRHADSNGWILKNGYIFKENDLVMRHERFRFNQLCGSCNILKFELWPLPESNEEFSDELIYFYSGFNHGKIESFFQDKGATLAELPFPGVIYIIGNGENIYQKDFSKINGSHQGNLLFHIKQLRKIRPLRPSTRQEFGLYGMSR